MKKEMREVNITDAKHRLVVLFKSTDEKLCTDLSLFTGEIINYLTKFDNDTRLINLDPNLSDKGKQTKIDSLKPNHVIVFENFAKRFFNIRESLRPRVENAQTAAVYVSKDPLRDELRAREVRDLLRAQGTPAIIGAYLNPSLDGFVKWCIQSSPIPLLTDLEILRRGAEGQITAENRAIIDESKEFLSRLADVITKACAYLGVPVPAGVNN